MAFTTSAVEGSRRVSRASAAGAGPLTMDETLTFPLSAAVLLDQVRLHSDAALGAFQFWVDSAQGTSFDTVLFSDDITALSYVWQPERHYPIGPGDSLQFHAANGDSVDWGLEVYWIDSTEARWG